MIPPKNDKISLAFSYNFRSALTTENTTLAQTMGFESNKEYNNYNLEMAENVPEDYTEICKTLG